MALHVVQSAGGSASGGTRVGLLASIGDPAAYEDQSYFATDDNGGTLYVSDGTEWIVAAPRGTEIGYAEMTVDQTTTSTTTVPFSPPISITVEVADRPIVVIGQYEFVSHSAAGGTTSLDLLQDGAVIASGGGKSGAANEIVFCAVRRRLSLAPGSYVFSLNKRVTTGTGTYWCQFGSQGQLQAWEV